MGADDWGTRIRLMGNSEFYATVGLWVLGRGIPDFLHNIPFAYGIPRLNLIQVLALQ